jgi:hypothetical protein
MAAVMMTCSLTTGRLLAAESHTGIMSLAYHIASVAVRVEKGGS